MSGQAVIKFNFEDDECLYSGDKKIRILPLFGVMYDDFYAEHPMARAEVIPEDRLIRYSYSSDERYTLELMVSGPAMCISCGTNIDGDCDNPASLMCESCSGLVRCENCGEPFYEGELILLADGNEWCECCVEYYSRLCDCCGSTYARDSVESVYLEHRDELLSHEHIDMCDNCACSDRVHKMFGDFGSHHGIFSSRRTVNTRNMTDEAFAIFGYETEEDVAEFRAEIEEYEREKEES